MSETPTRYDIATDEVVPVTQDWVDHICKLLNAFGNAREAAANAVVANETTAKLNQKFLDAWEYKK